MQRHGLLAASHKSDINHTSPPNNEQATGQEKSVHDEQRALREAVPQPLQQHRLTSALLWCWHGCRSEGEGAGSLAQAQ